jgi:hypothetical protein
VSSPPQGPPQAPPPAKPPGASRYTWFLGVVAVLLLAVVTINTFSTEGVQSGGPERDDELVRFAVPLADAPSRPDEDAQIDQDKVCSVRGAGILNLCEIQERGPLVLALFPTDASRCRSVLAQFERVSARVPRVSFVAVGSGGDRDDLRGEWTFPVGWDKDRAVASIYGLVGCPQITFAGEGGRVAQTTHRPLSDDELAGIARDL